MSKYINIMMCITVIILMVVLIFIPKHEVPTDAEWKSFLQYEEDLNKWKDENSYDFYLYDVKNRATNEVYFYGTLAECMNVVDAYEDTYGNCVIMPRNMEGV